MPTLATTIEHLYTGSSLKSVRFRYAMITFDLVTIVYFILAVPLPKTLTIELINLSIAAIILTDFLCRFWLSRSRVKHMFKIYVLSDLIVLASIVLNPFTGIDLEFLRILRGLRFGYSNYLLDDLRRDFDLFRRREHVFVALINLLVFLFITASSVYTLTPLRDGGFDGYINAIYFTVATLTTTGYGDIVPQDNFQKMLSVVIMIGGVTLFVNLARVLFIPQKVSYTCESCGLSRHDPDAVHCKHCGVIVKIETTGAD